MTTHPAAKHVLLACLMISVLPTGCAKWRARREARRDARIEARDQKHTSATEALANAQALREQGLHRAAIAEFERVIEINPDMTVAYLGAAELYAAEGDYGAAEEKYAAAVDREPRNFEAQYGQGLMLQLLDRVAEAIRAYLRALTIQPDDFNANLNLATAYLQLGEPAQALTYAERAVTLDRDNAAGRVNLGAVYAALGRHADAIIEYQQAAELMELTPELLLNLADSLGHEERYAEMRQTLEQLIAIEPSALAYERLGSASFRMGEYGEALAQFQRALEFDPDYYPALNGVGVCKLNVYVLSDMKDRAALDAAREALLHSLQVKHDQPQVLQFVTRYR